MIAKCPYCIRYFHGKETDPRKLVWDHISDDHHDELPKIEVIGSDA